MVSTAAKYAIALCLMVASPSVLYGNNPSKTFQRTIPLEDNLFSVEPFKVLVFRKDLLNHSLSGLVQRCFSDMYVSSFDTNAYNVLINV